MCTLPLNDPVLTANNISDTTETVKTVVVIAVNSMSMCIMLMTLKQIVVCVLNALITALCVRYQTAAGC